MQQLEQLRLFVEAAPIASVVADAVGVVAAANEHAAVLFGCSREELFGRALETLLPGVFRVGPYAREFMAVRKNEPALPVEVGLNRISTPDGEFSLIAIVGVSERRSPEEQPRLIVEEASNADSSSVVDITERKVAEEMRRQRDLALDASQLKSQFVATMSHELRTPLNAIIAAAELLTSTELDPRQRAYVETIDDSAEALLAVISSILDFSKIEAGKLELETRTFKLEALVEGTAGLLAPQARERGLRLHVYIDPSIPGSVRGDADRLRQILLNLLSNALKFTAEGKIFVRALPVETSSRHAIVRFEVEDTGIGIEPDTVARLFEPFVQADGSSSRRFGGTGLGLSISKRLVELMNGEIGVTTEAGRGSVFWFTVRFSLPSAIVPSRRFFGVRALLISSDQVFQDIAGRYVEAWGIAAHPVTGAAAALELLQMRRAAGRHEDWLAIVDAESVDADATVQSLMARGIPSRSILRAGSGERLSRPLRHSQLFDRIVEALEEPNTVTRTRADPAGANGSELSSKVLVAEDNAGLREILAAQFAHLRIPVTIVSNGAEAVAALAREAFALVFMDCHMPELDGFAATRVIRDAEKTSGAHVPIVAMTANAFKEDREACLAIGMDDYLAKPVRLVHLRETVSRWIAAPEHDVVP